MEISFYAFEHYEYEGHPLFFARMPYRMNDSEILALLKAVDRYYGDCDMDTDEWALEFQLWTRMLISSNCLCVNPRHISISHFLDCEEGIRETLESYQDKRNLQAFEKILALPELRLNHEYGLSGDTDFTLPVPASNG